MKQECKTSLMPRPENVSAFSIRTQVLIVENLNLYFHFVSLFSWTSELKNDHRNSYYVLIKTHSLFISVYFLLYAMSLAQSLILFAVYFQILERKVVIGIQMKECGSTF